MGKKVTVEICACTRCSMVGAMEIAQDVVAMQGVVDEEDGLVYEIDLINVSKPELTPTNDKAPLVIVNGVEFYKADSATIMDEIIRASHEE